MGGVKCICTPLVCSKCLSEFKTLKQLKQHLEEQHNADRKHISLVSRKHLEAKKMCNKCNSRLSSSQLTVNSTHEIEDYQNCRDAKASSCETDSERKENENADLVIDTDEEEDMLTDSVDYQSQVSCEVKCNCPKLKCFHCSDIFNKCRDLWRHMCECGHIDELFFKTVRQKKKKLKSMCPVCSKEKSDMTLNINEKLLKITLDSDGDKNKLPVDKIPAKSEGDLDNLLCIQNIENCQSVALSTVAESEKGKSPSCAEITKPMDIANNENSLVVINISQDESGMPVSRVEMDQSEQQQNLASEDAPSPLHLSMRKCIQQCLQLVNGETKTQSRTVIVDGKSINPEVINQLNELVCFICSKKFAGFDELKNHLISEHSLRLSRNDQCYQNSEIVKILHHELMLIECKCIDFVCEKCKTSFQTRLSMLSHISENHYDNYSPLVLHGDKMKERDFCNQCLILQKLWHINYKLFITVLQYLENASNEDCKALLHYYPSKTNTKKSSKAKSKGNFSMSIKDLNKAFPEAEDINSDEEFEVQCYCILQQNSQSPQKVTCVCPMLKCPKCPKATCSFSDLRRHVRLNNHDSFKALRLLWRDYKFIKKHCPSCKGFSYQNYIMCPHCPHLNFEDEDKANDHMKLIHGCPNSDKDITCTCTNVFLCFTCNKYYRTPQGLHHHMRRLGHETPENFDAIPEMIKEKLAQRKGCPHCSLLIGPTVPEGEENEDQAECTCKWAVCKTCGNSYKKVRSLLSHMTKMKHKADDDYIQSEREKVIASFKECHKCNSNEDRFCIFCNKRENFVYHHIKTHHQDQIIMLQSDDKLMTIDEYQAKGMKYQCSICLKRFLHTTTLRCHVKKVHPHHYFTLQCLNLESDCLTLENFTGRQKIRVIDAIPLQKKNHSEEEQNFDPDQPSTSGVCNSNIKTNDSNTLQGDFKTPARGRKRKR